MPSVLRFAASAQREPLFGQFVLVGRKEDVIVRACKVFQEPSCQSILNMVLSKSSASAHAGGHAHATLPASEQSSGQFVNFHAVLLPQAATRYNAALRPDVISRHFGKAATPLHDDGKIAVEVVLPQGVEQVSGVLSAAAALARALPLYTRKGNVHEVQSSAEIQVCFVTQDDTIVSDETLLTQAQHVADGVRDCARLVDMPCNELHCKSFSDIVKDATAALPHVTFNEIVGADLEAQGFGGIFSVGQAAKHPPRLVILDYKPEGAGDDSVVLAGKGIVYDTGGLSIKGKTAMPGMKRDMGGAAGVFGAFVALVKSGYKRNVHCLLALAENSVDSVATRPDDVVVMYSGKTVEINNTDAEGRLVLADAVAYAAKTYNPSVILNMCTLTGAQGISTGQLHASLVCSDEATEAQLLSSGRASGDLCHPMMWCPELFSNEFSSAVADMKNSVKNRSNAQVSCAAQFIGNHLPEDFFEDHVWAHVDMAYPAVNGERGTGYGVALLFHWLQYGRE